MKNLKEVFKNVLDSYNNYLEKHDDGFELYELFQQILKNLNSESLKNTKKISIEPKYNKIKPKFVLVCEDHYDEFIKEEWGYHDKHKLKILKKDEFQFIFDEFYKHGYFICYSIYIDSLIVHSFTIIKFEELPMDLIITMDDYNDCTPHIILDKRIVLDNKNIEDNPENYWGNNNYETNEYSCISYLSNFKNVNVCEDFINNIIMKNQYISKFKEILLNYLV